MGDSTSESRTTSMKQVPLAAYMTYLIVPSRGPTGLGIGLNVVEVLFLATSLQEYKSGSPVMTSYDIPLLNCGGVIFGSQGMGEALAPPGFKDPPTPNPNERVSAEW
ncbi:MAG: hypothetical protein ACK6BM_04605, partial [Cyanobacteriota bacterium]